MKNWDGIIRVAVLKTFATSGRGDNNKHDSSGRGSSNQSNQPFVADDAKQRKSNRAKKQTEHNLQGNKGKRRINHHTEI
jgi:hypothetical protein